MKKSYKSILVLALLSLASGVLVSCQGGDTPTPSNNGQLVNEANDAAVSYNIINASEDVAYLEGLPEKGEAHKSYSFRVSLKPGYHFNDKLTIFSGETSVPFMLENHYYTFEMPEGDVAITLDVGQTDFTIKTTSKLVGKVVLDNESDVDYSEAEEVRSAIVGTPLKFQALPTEDFTFNEVTVNGKALEETDGYYHFTMPAKPVIIGTDETAIAYDVTLANELTLSTATIYTNEETKEPITTAIKGDKVFLSFAHEVKAVKYTISVKTVVDEGETAEELNVTQINDDLFSFDMISKNITISVTEKDISLYQGHFALGSEQWHTYEEYGSSNGVKTKAYSDMTSNYATFDVDGKAAIRSGYGNPTTYEWTPDAENANLFSFVNSSGKNVLGAVTEHLIAYQYFQYGSINWGDVYLGVSDADHELHVLSVGKDYRLIWTEDEEGNITDTLFIIGNDQIIANVTVKNEDGLPALGSEITKDSTFDVFDGETKLVKISACAAVVESAITVSLAEHTTLEIKDEAGNAITSSVNNKKITIHAALTDDAPEGLSIKEPVVKDASGKAITITKVEDQENTWTFTMPNSAVAVQTRTKDMTKYQNYPGLGEYIAYNLYNRANDDKDFSKSIVTYYFNFESSGEATKVRGSSTDYYTIESIDNATSGVMTLSNSANTTENIYFGDGLMATPYSFGGTYSDCLIGIRLPEGATLAQVKNQVHYGIGDNNASWAVSYFVNDELFASMFCYKGTVYVGGITFEFDEGSTRVDSTSSYHVKKDGVTIFDVANNVATPHTAE